MHLLVVGKNTLPKEKKNSLKRTKDRNRFENSKESARQRCKGKECLNKS